MLETGKEIFIENWTIITWKFSCYGYRSVEWINWII